MSQIDIWPVPIFAIILIKINVSRAQTQAHQLETKLFYKIILSCIKALNSILKPFSEK